jgi:hypothetical protein
MPRLRLRLSNLVMLLIIIALVMALAIQRRREMDLREHLQFLSTKHSAELMMRDRRHSGRATEVARLQARVARLTALDESTLPDQTVDNGENGTPAK